MKIVDQPVDPASLGRLRLLHCAGADDVRKLLAQCQLCTVEADETLLSPRKANHHLYMVLEGSLTVYVDSLDSQPLRVIDTNDCAGEVSFVDHLPPTVYVVANQPCTLLRLHSRHIGVLGESPHLMHNLALLLCERVRLSDRLIVDSEHNANVDMLTGVFNRRWLEHAFERDSTRCAMAGSPLCMLMLDVDRFKQYNDSHGHLAGDLVLSLVARTLAAQLRPKDCLVRYGGEEFTILLPELAAEDARAIGERLRQAIEQVRSIPSPIGRLPGVTVSIGLAVWQPADRLADLIERADRELYQAKQGGRNQLCG
ncbi:GGDEF domain-containing protein [Pseudomonadota bacterium DY0742]